MHSQLNRVKCVYRRYAREQKHIDLYMYNECERVQTHTAVGDKKSNDQKEKRTKEEDNNHLNNCLR